MIIAGVDEAGRGPVIGPLVMAGVALAEKDLPKLEALGLKDSKLLSPAQREQLYETLMELEYITHHISSAQPSEIDEVLASPNINLNGFEALHTAIIINKLKPDKAIIDLPTNNAEAYNNLIKRNLTYTPILVSEHKADATYAVVSAASIIAKVTRDRAIMQLKKEIGIDFGSGYPSDPLTVAFLQKQYANSMYKHIFRKSWQSYQRLITKKRQKHLGDF